MEDLDIVFAKLDEYVSITNKDFCDFIEKKLNICCCKAKSIKNWEKWLEMREEQYKHLGAAVNRTPDELIMNRESPWILKHEKGLLEELDKLCCHDKYRGHPNFWITTEDACGKSRNEQKITLQTYPGTLDFSRHKTATTGFGYFGCPPEMMAEKGLTRDCRSLKTYDSWKSNPQVQRAEMSVKPILNRIEPFKAATDHLLVIGKGYSEENEDVEEEVAIGPEIKITPPTAEEESAAQSGYWQDESDPYSVSEPIIKIGHTYINSAEGRTGFLCYISLYDVGCRGENKKTVRIANKGTTVLHYKWKQVNCYKNNFPLKVSNSDKPRFFFDNTNGVILPGKKRLVFFLFKSFSPGTYKEVWQFITRPSMQAEPIFFILFGISTKENEPEISAAYINDYINMCKKKSRIIERSKAESIEPPVSLYKFNELFSEVEKFEYNNPKLYYHRHEVQLLKSIYFKITKQPWNYSMRDLNNTINRVKNEKTRNKFLKALQLIHYSLQRPPIHRHIPNNTYTGVYTLLCQCMNEIEIVFVNLESVFCLQPLPRTELLYEKEEPLPPEPVKRRLLKKDKYEKIFQEVIKKYFIPRKVTSMRIGNIVVPLNRPTFNIGVMNTFRKKFMNVVDNLGKKVEHRTSIDKPETPRLRRTQQVINRTKSLSTSNLPSTNVKTNKDNQKSEPPLQESQRKRKKKLTRAQRKIKKRIERILAKKKFINYIEAKQTQKRIKFKPEKDRKRFRHIFIYQCKIILSKTIDEITSFLASTEMVDDVLQVEHPLVGTHPRMAYSYVP